MGLWLCNGSLLASMSGQFKLEASSRTEAADGTFINDDLYGVVEPWHKSFVELLEVSRRKESERILRGRVGRAVACEGGEGPGDGACAPWKRL